MFFPIQTGVSLSQILPLQIQTMEDFDQKNTYGKQKFNISVESEKEDVQKIAGEFNKSNGKADINTIASDPIVILPGQSKTFSYSVSTQAASVEMEASIPTVMSISNFSASRSGGTVDISFNLNVASDAPVYTYAVSWTLVFPDHDPYQLTYDYYIATLEQDFSALEWHTFLGSYWDYGWGIALDGDDNIYIAGNSRDTWGTPISAHGEGVDAMDAFVVKLNNDGYLVWNTFMGSSVTVVAQSITLDASGNIYITGNSFGTWGTPIRSYATGGITDSNQEIGLDIVLDDIGNIYVTGMAMDTWGTPINAFVPGNNSFAAKLDNNGVLQWNTFMGDTESGGNNIVLDNEGNIYVANDGNITKLDSDGIRIWESCPEGWTIRYIESLTFDNSDHIYITGSSKFSWGTPINSYTGGTETFVAKLSTDGAWIWNTFMGCLNGDNGYGITLDGRGSVYVTGSSQTGWGTPQNAHVGFWDVLISILNTDGALLWHTFLGSPGWSMDVGSDITIDGSGNVYITGFSEGAWGAPINAFEGSWGAFHAFVAKLSINNTFVATYSDTEIPSLFVLHQNFPNPFNPETTISFELPNISEVTINVFNMAGQKVIDLFKGRKEKGNHTLKWNAHNYPSGVYFIKMQADGFTQMRKCILMK